jgi:hypothetical protein
LYRWLENDPGLRARVEKAEADVEVRLAAEIVQAAPDDWRAAAWMLERRRPTSYGRAQAAAATAAMTAAPTPGPNPLDDLTPEEIRERARTWALDLAALPPSAATSPAFAQGAGA